ncbi:hypothetical protein AKJ09_07290 [Labilithrix luteola]|uniref:VWFA domain-containing protein n=1 Tax=Labilithrix luteola TaxID=1391654 RepID=A0A0K1Q4N6_9BACT|nr:hypothetical protein AKJ09_07290 [Labilithrix luteola]
MCIALLASAATACGTKIDRSMPDDPNVQTGESEVNGPDPDLSNGGFGDPDAAPLDAGNTDSSFETCAATAVEATRERLPVDIIWVVDNSSSMAPAVAAVQAGLNDFATLIASKGIDYKVIMLSKKGATATSSLYPVCIPPPLGTANCGNSPTFFHASLNVKSTQPLEQFLGTLDQTKGYTTTDSYGSEPWSQELRAGATKTIVVVTDDNSRFSATDFETFPGGANPSASSRMLPPGILDPSRGNQFAGYTFDAIYGWGSATDPGVTCTYTGGTTKPASSGPTYTTLVTKTGGVRAKICDTATAWKPFFDAVAQSVVSTSRVACELDIPAPDGGTLDPNSVNVRMDDGTGAPVTPPRVSSAADCASADGWYYDDPAAPKKVLLCPTSCENAQSKGGQNAPKVEVLFGCVSIVR